MWRSRLMRWLFVLLVGTVSVLLLNNRKRAEDLRRARVTNKTLSRNLRELGDWSGKATARIEETESRLRAAERHLERETGRSLEHFIVQEDRAQRERARLAGKRVAIWKLEKSIGGYET